MFLRKWREIKVLAVLQRIKKAIISIRLAVVGRINFDVVHPLTSLAHPYYPTQEPSGFILWNKRVKSTRNVEQTTKLITHWQTTYTADLRGLQRSRSIHCRGKKQPLCALYIKSVLPLETKTTGVGNIYYLVCCNHETLQNGRELLSKSLCMKLNGEKEERGKRKTCRNFCLSELLLHTCFYKWERYRNLRK